MRGAFLSHSRFKASAKLSLPMHTCRHCAGRTFGSVRVVVVVVNIAVVLGEAIPVVAIIDGFI